MFTQLTQKLDSFIKHGIPGYDCVVYHKGECIYRRYKGYSDRENKIPMRGKELYNIYSCSKIITCTAALMLYEKGMYKLEDKLSDYMPEFESMYVNTENGLKKTERYITIKDLFCMTAGFSYNLNSPMIQKCQKETKGRCQTRVLMKYLAQEPLLFEPGERWEYSLCHDVLAAFVETISGKRFGEFVKENIFDCLEMNNSTFLLDDLELDKVCSQYKGEKIELRPKTIDYKLGTEYESGGAGCVSTVEDYIKFLEALRMGELLKPETIELMLTNQLNDHQIKTYWVENYGYGLGIRCKYKDESISDFGWGGAAGAYAIVDPKYEYTAFYVQHVLNSPIQNMRNEILPMIKEVIKKRNETN